MLRDGSYKEARYLKSNESLMPLYTKISEKGTIGYRLFYNPFENLWHYEHRSFCLEKEIDGKVVHHKNYDKLNNCPYNLVKISVSKHTKIHNNSTRDYKKISESVRKWHSENKNTKKYDERRENCRKGVVAYYEKTTENYVNKKESNLSKICEIENMFNVSWDDLTQSEKESYGVRYSRQKDTTITKRISDTLSIRHKEGKFDNAHKAISNRVWYTNGSENIYIKQDENPPCGYRRGRTMTNINLKHYKFSELSLDEAERRRSLCASAKGKKWITNGLVDRYIDANEPLPDGFSYGRKSRKNHKVKSVTYIHKPCRVYDIEVDDNHNFALDAGVFVHNSKDMSDSLAGAVLNATKHKDSLVDSGQLLSTMANINAEVNPQEEFMQNFASSLAATQTTPQQRAKNSQLANDALNNLLNNFGNDNILMW
jgi:DNA gyrase subunit B